MHFILLIFSLMFITVSKQDRRAGKILRVRLQYAKRLQLSRHLRHERHRNALDCYGRNLKNRNEQESTADQKAFASVGRAGRRFLVTLFALAGRFPAIMARNMMMCAVMSAEDQMQPLPWH